MKDRIAKQHNAITQAEYTMTGLELDLFACLVALTNLSDADGRQKVRIRLSDLEDLTGKRYNGIEVEQACNSLHTRVARIEDSAVVDRYSMVITSRYYKNDRSVELEMHPDLRPWFVHLNKHYTYYQLAMTLLLPSKFSKRMYQLICQFRSSGFMIVGEEELKKKLGVMYQDEEGKEWHDSYPRNDKFQERVLKKAREDVSLHTDMTFDYKPLKTGRKITAYRFTIKHKPTQQTIPFKKEISPSIPDGHTKLPYPAGSPPEIRLPAYRLAPWQVKRILENFDKQEITKILYSVDLALADKKVSNLGAYTAAQFEKHKAIGVYKQATQTA